MPNVLEWIIARGKEPSTWAGLAAALGISSEAWTSYSAAVVAAFGTVAVVLNEKSE